MLSNSDLKNFKIMAQPNDVTCGPTCLHAVYNYYGDNIELEQVIKQVKKFRSGGTIAAMLGNHALVSGFKATIYTYNLHIFDPTWFTDGKVDLAAKLISQLEIKNSPQFSHATSAYLEYLELGGKIRMKELTPSLIRKFLVRKSPILTGLSATYLYQSAREIEETNQYDDIKGEPAGHFVVICDYNKKNKEVIIADPLYPNPLKKDRRLYSVKIDKLINAILLGIATYDANLLIIKPRKHAKNNRH